MIPLPERDQPRSNIADVARVAAQDVELMPQHWGFGFKPASRLEAVAQRADEKEGNCEHPTIMF